MTYPDGSSETRTCWTEETFDGETVHYLITRSGSKLRSTWKTTENNKWMQAYISLWYQRFLDEQNRKMIDLREQEDIEIMRAAQLAKADLGFDW